MQYIERFAKLYDDLGINYAICKDMLWVPYNRMVQPLGPIKSNYSISSEEARCILREIGGILIRRTDGFEGKKSKEWYAVICDEFKGLDPLSQNTRSKIRRGLKRNEIKLIDAPFLVKNGYPVYSKMFKKSQGTGRPDLSEKEFSGTVINYKNFEDIIHIWGVFNNEKLVAFAINYVFGKLESFYYIVSLDPEYTKEYTSYALYYEMNKYYLEENNFEYVNEGFRNILHKTEIHDYLQNKFLFRKAFTNLYIDYKPYLKTILYGVRPFKFIINKLDPRIDALLLQETIHRKCSGIIQEQRTK